METIKNIIKNNFYVLFVALLAILATVIIVAVALTKGMENRTVSTTRDGAYAPIATAEMYGATEIAVQEETVTIQKNSQNIIKGTKKSTEGSTENTTESTTESTAESTTESTVETTTESTVVNTTESSVVNTTQPSPTAPTGVIMATAETQKSTASYQTQWDNGYLLALDYPDFSYSCPHVELSEESRAIVENICMTEFGSGGFTGAALIAQSLKNAMVYYETDDVLNLAKKLNFSAKKSDSVSKDVKDAVIYIFDMDKDAVQHRILYKYNPETTGKLSEYYESKKYVCTYTNVRFFDE